MNVTTMRRIDCWLGMPVCFFLTCWRCCFGRRMPKGSDKPQRILFIKLAEQGSTVLAQQAIQAALYSAVNREQRMPVMFAWIPGYDFELRIFEARQNGGATSMTIIFASPYGRALAG